MKRLIAPFLVLFIASSTFAQQGPPPPQSGDQNQQDNGGAPPPPPPGGMNRGGPGTMGGNQGPGIIRGAPGPDMGRLPGPPPMADRMRTVEMLRGYLDLVDRYTRLSSNPTSSGVAAVVTAGDILKARGKDAAIDYFNKVLPDVKDPAVQRAIRLQLADLYKAAGESDKALEQLHMLMTDTGAAPAKSQ